MNKTVLHDIHEDLGAKMVDFGGWDMPVQYPGGIMEEHLAVRSSCGLFDVSHMGRFLIRGLQKEAYLQHVLSSNVSAMEINRAQYCMIPSETGGAVDDAYLCRFEEDSCLLVVNAVNIEKDKSHLLTHMSDYKVELEDISDRTASFAVQGPKSQEVMTALLEGEEPTTEPCRNALRTTSVEGRPVRISRTGYTGEPLGYEIYIRSEDAVWFWNRLLYLGAVPAGLGARDTLRLEASMPLYGHELGVDRDGNEIPIFAVPLARFAVSFRPEKGSFVGREPLEKQAEASRRIGEGDFSACKVLPCRIRSIALLGRGVLRADCAVYYKGEEVGYVTSGTMVPYFVPQGEGSAAVPSEKRARRSIGLAYLRSDLQSGDAVTVDIRGRQLDAVIVSRHLRNNVPPYAIPVVCRSETAP